MHSGYLDHTRRTERFHLILSTQFVCFYRNFNQICFENNRFLQRELDIVRQELKHQGEEIERLKQETYPNSGQTRNSMKAERSSVKTDHTNDEVFQTDSTNLSHDVNSYSEKIFRQGRILMPLNSSSPSV